MNDNFLTRFRNVNVARADRDFKNYSLPSSTLFFAVGMAGEMGELLNLVKKLERKAHGGPDVGNSIKAGEINIHHLEEEIGGVLTYLDLLASRYSISLEEALTKTFNKVSDKLDSRYRL